MKTLQTIQKKPYASPVIEVLEAENDMPLLANSTRLQREDLTTVSSYSSENGGLADEVEE